VSEPPPANTEPLPLEALAGIGEQGLAAILDAQRRGRELNIRISDLERNGPTLLLDGTTPDGKHVMMWNHRDGHDQRWPLRLDLSSERLALRQEHRARGPGQAGARSG